MVFDNFTRQTQRGKKTPKNYKKKINALEVLYELRFKEDEKILQRKSSPWILAMYLEKRHRCIEENIFGI